MLIRPAEPGDRQMIAGIVMPVIRAGDSFALPRDMPEDQAIAYWTGADRETFVAEEDGVILGTYYLRANQAGGGRHVANCGYMTSSAAMGRGIARAMCAHSIEVALERGFLAMQFNFVVSTNTRAIALWQALGFEPVGRLPAAFRHPSAGYVDAIVMYRSLSAGWRE